ncbi:MAG: DUF1015 domain-containing protein [Heliobacteriaceae bacterium]|nr:DUF1015 domain-containing protein [Heliobacteriaceae bacterium]
MGAAEIGLHVPTILLPAPGIDLTKWAVVACDQYTSQPEYWTAVAEFVGEQPSTLHLIFPEVYLAAAGKTARIAGINRTMREYLANRVLVPQPPGFIYIDRQTARATSRKGLLVAVDLEHYDYRPGAQTLIRATEGTVLDRLPPRLQIRANACLELPHVMLLIDDPARTVIEPLAAWLPEMPPVYDFKLMQGGGRIRGWRVAAPHLLAGIRDAFRALAAPAAFRERYGVGPEQGVLIFATGDGNHSLATAKAFWEELKPGLSAETVQNHPARFALAEVVNIHDPGIVFEPIHRVLFNVNPEQVLVDLVAFCRREGAEAEVRAGNRPGQKAAAGAQLLPFVTAKQTGVVIVRRPRLNLAVGTLQAFLDTAAGKYPGAQVDYIHGDAVVDTLGSQPGNIGFHLPTMDKNDLFKTVILDGVLPRKTFSMGEAAEKRYYLECRQIVP